MVIEVMDKMELIGVVLAIITMSIITGFSGYLFAYNDAENIREEVTEEVTQEFQFVFDVINPVSISDNVSLYLKFDVITDKNGTIIDPRDSNLYIIHMENVTNDDFDGKAFRLMTNAFGGIYRIDQLD